MPASTSLDVWQTLEDASPLCTAAPNAPLQKLNALRPTPLLPSKIVNRRLKAVLALKRIESLQVTKSDDDGTDGSMFTIEICYRESRSRIPVHRVYAPTTPPSDPQNRQSRVLVEHSFRDFLELTHDAYELLRLSHVVDKCVFCRHLIFYNTASDLKPRWNSHWFKSEREVCEMLTAYLGVMLQYAVDVQTGGVDLCRGQERVPRLLQQFLRSPDAPRQSF